MRPAFTLLATVTTLLLVGCGGPSGGGSTTINQRVVVYGIGKEGVSFAIFTDIPAVNTQTRAGSKSGVLASQQTGSIMPASGTRIDYAGDSVSLKVGEQAYVLAKGRIFLLTTGDGNIDIRQVDIPIQPTGLSSETLRGEIQRLAENPEVSSFTANSEQEAR